MAYGFNTTGNSNWAADIEATLLYCLNAIAGTTGSGAGATRLQKGVTNASSNIFKTSTLAAAFPSGYVTGTLLVYHSGFRMRNVTVVSASGGTFRVTENSTAGTAVAGADYPYIYVDGVRR